MAGSACNGLVELVNPEIDELAEVELAPSVVLALTRRTARNHFYAAQRHGSRLEPPGGVLPSRCRDRAFGATAGLAG